MPEPRFGVFLRPDPEMCWAVTRITRAVRAQFGLVSAGAFPPHATIVGSMLSSVPVSDIEDAVTRAVRGRGPVQLVNGGLRAPDAGIPIDVHTDGRGNPNSDLLGLATAIFDEVLPLAVPGDDRINPSRREAFWAHLSLASHDLALRPDLYDEVLAFVRGLPIPIPQRSWADTVSLFEFRVAESWSGPWWESLTWRHVRSWPLTPSGSQPGW